MKKLALIFGLCALLCARANAQSTQPDLSFRFGINLLVLPGISAALEAREPQGGLGVRANTFYAVAVYGYGVDVYAFVPLSLDWDVYFGVGGWRMFLLFPPSNPTDFTYGLLGVRLRNGFFLEITPGVYNTGCTNSQPLLQSCASGRFFAILGTLGFAWRL
jgi:hypothetical protein